MAELRFRRLTGLFFILGAILVNIPYTLLVMNFEYPDILREPTAYVLTEFQAGGTGLLLTWLAFAWTGLPVVLGIIMLYRVLQQEKIPYLGIATVFGVVAGVAQIIGLLRWVFVVPVLAATYVDPAASEMQLAAVEIVFRAVHQYGGVVIGEHIGQIFTILWMAMISVAMFRSRFFRPWVGALGLLAAAVYALAQGELLATVVPGFPNWSEAGLIGSLMWLAWMIVMGVFLLIRSKEGVE